MHFSNLTSGSSLKVFTPAYKASVTHSTGRRSVRQNILVVTCKRPIFQPLHKLYVISTLTIAVGTWGGFCGMEKPAVKTLLGFKMESSFLFLHDLATQSS